MLQNRQLLLALIAHRPGYLDNHKATDAINKALGAEIPTVGAKTKKLTQIVQALDVKLEDHWNVNETFLDALTKTELDAVCVEVGLADAAGKHYSGLKNGSKKDFLKAMLKVEGFNYIGAIPKMMRWDSRA